MAALDSAAMRTEQQLQSVRAAKSALGMSDGGASSGGGMGADDRFICV